MSVALDRLIDLVGRVAQTQDESGRAPWFAHLAVSLLVFAGYTIEFFVYGLMLAVPVYLVGELAGLRGREGTNLFVAVIYFGLGIGTLRGLWHVWRYLTGRY
ncbi:MAG: hypothetical protein AAF690_16760 [Acidobacteriota bacterium]